MQQHLIKGIHADYIPSTWAGKDTSRIRVVGKTILVLMDKCSPMSKGGVSLPEDVVEKMSMAAESGVIVAVSPGAFLLNEDMTPWSGEKPKPGDRVYIEKYAGKLVRGADAEMYRIMDYMSVGAVFEADLEQKTGDK